ncbi:MAG TPA: DUF5694 domain-containing protein [Burkholderiaceae bacterium]
MKQFLLGVAACAILPGAFAADNVQVMVVGTYHFANQHLDVMNITVDDVSTPKRQAELAAVADGLARFKPTVVAVEKVGDAYPGHALPEYRAYLAGKDTDNRNEIVQMGYRLGKVAGLADVVGVNYLNPFPFGPVRQYAIDTGRGAQFQAALGKAGAKIKAFEQRQREQSVGQLLRSLNEPAEILSGHKLYVETLQYGSGATQPAVEMLGNWATRNLAICARLAQVAKSGDRIVVMFGNGHAHYLRQCVSEMPGWTLVEANAYLPN